MSATVLNSVFAHGGRTSRFGEFTVVFMHGASFITTPMEFMQVQNWARARVSTGNAVRDRTTFLDRFQTVLGRVGSGISSRGNKPALARIVKAMESNAVPLEEWAIPHNINESVEIVRRKPAAPAVATVTPADASESANELRPGSVTPLVPR